LLAAWFLTGTASASDARAAPDPEAIRAATRDILANGRYYIEQRERFRVDLSWFLEKVEDFFEFLFPALGSMGLPVTWIVVAVLVAVLIALIAHILYSFYTAIRTSAPESFELTRIVRVDPAELEAEAVQLAAQGNFVDASRALYQAALAMLEERRDGRVMSGLTNTEYLGTFQTAWVKESLKVFVDLINWKWYRDRLFEEADYRQCQQAYGRLRARLQQESKCSTPDTQASVSPAS